MLSGFISVITTTMLLLVGVSFYIVVERKGLGSFQLRKGPNKVAMKGLIQPFADGIKLLSKEMKIFSGCNKLLYMMSPLVLFSCGYSVWALFPAQFPSVFYNSSVLFFLCVSSFSVYGVVMAGWSSNSVYSVLGSMRAVAQTISYEVCFSGLIFCPPLINGWVGIAAFREESCSIFLFCLEVLMLWLMSCLAELNRAPFDFVEGESELVSGYNVEFGGVWFAMMALAEYSSMIFISVLTSLMFVASLVENTFVGNILLSMLTFLICYSLVWVRGSLPRHRYDKLMMLSWAFVLPLTLSLMLSCLSFSA